MGAQAVRRVIEAACRREIPTLTLFAFSSENWRRPAKEIHVLFRLLSRYLLEEKENLVRNGVRLSGFGRRDRIPAPVLAALAESERATCGCDRLHLCLALDYGSRCEIVAAARRLAREVMDGKVLIEQISEDRFREVLSTSAVPDPDLVIRTAGEQRLSNFLLWQSAYSELYFCQKLWPDFEESDLEEAIVSFRSRRRTFGALARATG